MVKESRTLSLGLTIRHIKTSVYARTFGCLINRREIPRPLV